MRFDERENFYAEGGENEVGVPGAIGRESGHQGREDEEGESHPPGKGGMPHEPGEANQEKEGKRNRCDDHKSLGLSGSGKAEFLVRFGNFLGSGHELKLMAGGDKGIFLVESAHLWSLRKPVCSLLRAGMSKATIRHGGLAFMFDVALEVHNFLLVYQTLCRIFIRLSRFRHQV